jgi:hypothetical protein
MNTIVIDIHDAARDLAGFIQHLREFGGRIVLTGEGGRLAEITPIAQPNSIATTAMQQPPSAAELDDEEMQEWGPRVVLSEISGLPIVAGRPGQRMVTSEEIYEELRGSGP